MAIKISAYPTTTTLANTDLLDVSTDLGGTPTTKAISYANLKVELNNDLSFIDYNIYTQDGTFVDDRTLNMNSFGAFWTNSAYYAIADDASAVIPSSALFILDSTSKGFLPPRMTTAQVNAIGTPIDGLMVYDSDVDKIKLRASGAWVEVPGSASAGGADTELQFNNGGTLDGDANMTWDDTNKLFTVKGNGTGGTPAFRVTDSADAITFNVQNSGKITGKNLTIDTGTPFNVFAGNEAGLNISTTSNSVLIGDDAGKLITAGAGIVAIGSAAYAASTGGSGGLIAIGQNAKNSGGGVDSIAIGNGAGYNDAALGNIHIGAEAGDAMVGTGNDHVITMGYRCGSALTTADDLTAIGTDCIRQVLTAQFSTYQGYNILGSSTGIASTNSMFGSQILGNSTAGTNSENCIMGVSVGFNATSMNGCVAVGRSAVNQSGIVHTDCIYIGKTVGQGLSGAQTNTLLIGNSSSSYFMYGDMGNNYLTLHDTVRDAALRIKGNNSDGSTDSLKIVTSGGAFAMKIRDNGTIQPASLADSAAPNDSIYYSTTAAKLVYKDSGGTVNNLY